MGLGYLYSTIKSEAAENGNTKCFILMIKVHHVGNKNLSRKNCYFIFFRDYLLPSAFVKKKKKKPASIVPLLSKGALHFILLTHSGEIRG